LPLKLVDEGGEPLSFAVRGMFSTMPRTAA
jgi:hypothetical protein